MPPGLTDYQGDSYRSEVKATPCLGIHGKSETLATALFLAVVRVQSECEISVGLRKVCPVRATKSVRAISVTPVKPSNTSTT